MYAPGDKIWSAWAGNTAAGSYQTGTSSASPYVAGAAALYLERKNDMTPDEVKKSILDDAFAGVLVNERETPNLLLNVAVFLSKPP